MNAHSHIETAVTAAVAIENGSVLDIPLNKLKASPKNARKVPHTQAAIEARAASIAAKGVLQPLVVEPELREDGAATGAYLVTIGEGRRQALRLLASRKRIKKTHPVRCVVDTVNDPLEISLDENVSRNDMHPADQFDAFRDLTERKGWGAEEIGARFGVSAQVVRQRLRLGAVSPKLMAIYREDGLTLDQLMAFAVSEDHERQEQVFEQLAHNRQPYAIRRAMTQAKVPADDRRAIFVGVEAYAEAGGTILRDLFTEDRGGWLEDVVLLDRLAAEKIVALAEGIGKAEGWKWAEGHLDYPSAHGLARVYPRKVERTPEQQAEIEAVSAEYDVLVEQWSHVEDLPSEVEARLKEIDAKLDAFGDGYAFDPDEIARGGVFVVLTQDGTTRIERGLIRAEDAKSDPEPEAVEEGDAPSETSPVETDEPEEPEGLAPLSDRLVADLSAHRTAALRDALAANPDIALLATVHAMVLRAFYAGAPNATCLDLRLISTSLAREAEGIEDSPAERRIAERHEAWARQLPGEAGAAWAFVVALDGDSRASLLAHCVALSVHAVRGWERRPGVWDHADTLATALALDMTGYWTPTVRSYLGRVTKARIGEAVREAVGEEAAERIAGLKKPEMAQAAEPLLSQTGWLPPVLRTGTGSASAVGDQPADHDDGPGEPVEGGSAVIAAE
ncbi:MAG: ParB/RepB/Spo0J family partition protein [Caulobacterales bacterium]|nr:ParB/RepB/Spo0J family partition protein [Caulobacterales bacterium]